MNAPCSPAMRYVVLVQLTALPAWLALDRPARQAVVSRHVTPLFVRHPLCRVRWADAESLTALCSDLLLVETTDLREWNHLWEGLRDSPLFATPYFRLEAIIPAIEDGYVDYEEAEFGAGTPSGTAARTHERR